MEVTIDTQTGLGTNWHARFDPKVRKQLELNAARERYERLAIEVGALRKMNKRLNKNTSAFFANDRLQVLARIAETQQQFDDAKAFYKKKRRESIARLYHLI